MSDFENKTAMPNFSDCMSEIMSSIKKSHDKKKEDENWREQLFEIGEFTVSDINQALLCDIKKFTLKEKQMLALSILHQDLLTSIDLLSQMVIDLGGDPYDIDDKEKAAELEKKIYARFRGGNNETV